MIILRAHPSRRLAVGFLMSMAASVASAQFDLTGTWTADDGGVYYLRQLGDRLWWAGLSTDCQGGSDFHRGLQYTNVFQGRITGNSIVGEWVEVPRGRTLQSGTLTLSIGATDLRRQAATGDLEATSWHRTTPDPAPADIFAVFDRVKKNQNAWRDHSLLDNLKPAKPDAVAIFGMIVREGDDLDSFHVNYHTYNGRTYNDFICLDGNDSPPDADIDFNIQVDRPDLDNQVSFWSGAWETNHGITESNFRSKLDRRNELHIESIMYGGTTECGDGGPNSILLPGWQQSGGAGVLMNGRPIAGQLGMIDRDQTSARIFTILNKSVEMGDRVRLTGILVLDCGHGWTHPCDEDDGDVQNQEVHPLYALDVVQNFSLPRAFANLTGAWGANDAGTYYLRQIGDTVWWFGLSANEGRTFANVFKGTVQGSQLTGEWADVPLGATSNAGTIALTGDSGIKSAHMTRASETGGFSGQTWEKLYDAGTRRISVNFDSATAGAVAFWQRPPAPEPFELIVGDQRAETLPTKPREVKTPSGSRAAQADLGTTIRVEASLDEPLRVTARYAGYRATWSIPTQELKAGTYSQSMTPPSRAAGLPEKPGETKGLKTGPHDRDTAAGRLPTLSITYRIEAVDGSDANPRQQAPPRR